MKRVVVAVLLLAALGVAACGDDEPSNESVFDSLELRAWRRAAETKRWNARASLLDAIEVQILRKDQCTRSLVLRSLGSPESHRGGTLFYNIGNQSGLGIDSVFLHVCFDESGKVTTWFQLQH